MKKLFFLASLTGVLLAFNVYAIPVFSVATPTIQNMVPNSIQNLTYTLSTTSPGAITIHCAFTSSNPNLTASFNNNGCTTTGGVGISNGLSDAVTLTLTTSAVASGSITGTITFSQTNGRHALQKYAIPITIPTTNNRTVTFKNYCPFNVTFGLSSSSVPAKNTNTIACNSDTDCSAFAYSKCISGFCGGGACRQDSDCVNTQAGTCKVPSGANTAFCTYCASDSDCLQGSHCNTSNNTCYWETPSPTDAAVTHYQLSGYSGTGDPDHDSVTLVDYSSINGYALMWGGGFAGRTGCTFLVNKNVCKTADCNINGIGDGQGGCELGEGFQQPATLAEVTYVSTNPDTYDDTIINGLNIPIAIYPSANSKGSPSSYHNPYVCGTAGGITDTITSNGTLGKCSWEFNPPNIAFRWVDSDNATTCGADSTCIAINSNYRCGYTSNTVTTNTGQKTCGTPLGYWNQNQICAANANFNADTSVVDCTITNIGGTGNSIINLLGCTGNAGVSCYNVSASNSVCGGCTNWQDQGIAIPSNSSIVQQCQYPNPYWGSGSSPATGNVLPSLIWLKKACPSAYVYPFDDKSSTFTCPGNDGQSAVDYTVEFCPGQKTAL